MPLGLVIQEAPVILVEQMDTIIRTIYLDPTNIHS